MPVHPRLPISLVAGAVVGASLIGCAGPESTSTNVQMLWYGSTSDDTPTFGVTGVEVTARDANTNKPFAVDMSAAGAAGDQWQTAAWTAATVGSMLASTDPRGVTISYRLRQGIDGPSAGAVLATAVLADLTETKELSDTVTMTGTVLPSGAIGPVGGIPAKLRAASDAGITTVLIPQGQGIAVDPVSGRRVPVAELAAELGLDVVQVASIQEALEYFSPGPPPVAPAPSPPQSPSLGPQSSETFVESARAAAQRIAGLPVAESPIASLTAERQRIASGVEQAISRTRSLIAEGRAADAFARATLAERALLAWNAQAQAVSAATTDLGGTAAAIAAQASEVRAAADTAIASNSSVPVTFLEQAAALPDALCWATDAWANASVAAAELEARTATTASALGELAGTLASARYDLDTYLPFSLAHARSIGLSEITDPTETNAILTGYAQLLADTGDTVLNDARRQGPSASTAPLVEDPQAWEFAVLQALGSRWDDQQRAAGSQDAVSASLTTAMSYYVAASTLAATSELAHSEGDRRVFSPADWTTQVDVATAESLRSAIRAETLGLDPDYLAWNEGFGRGAATAADTTGANDAFRLGGLQVQWYGNVQGHMLLTLAGARSATATTG